jgi:cytochrome c2
VPTGWLRGLSLLGASFLASVVWIVWDEIHVEWRLWQERLVSLEKTSRSTESPPGEDERMGIQQIWLKDLGRVDRCTTCHLAIADSALVRVAENPLRPHPGTWLEKHAPQRFGCTVCHGGQGDATSYRDAAHRAIPHWPEPMRSPDLMEAGCGVCHHERRPRRAFWLATGRTRIAESNCVACHDIPGFDVDDVRAPRLDGIGLKVSVKWLRRWLDDPRSYLPRSRMPNFRLNQTERNALAAFLSAERAVAPLEVASVDWDRADADRGGTSFRSSRCVTCHAVDGRGGTTGPELTRVASKATREAIFSFVKNPHHHQPDTLMPRFRFADEEIRDIVEHATTEWFDVALGTATTAPVPTDERSITAGRAVFVRRGCYACHSLASVPAPAKIGPKLSGVGDRIVDMSFLERQRIAPSLPNWIFTKLRAPETMARAARMPTFGFTPVEAASIDVALLGLRAAELSSERLTSDPPLLPYDPQGAIGALVRRYRCMSCHTVGGDGGTLSTVALDTIGSQLRPEHLESFLSNPFAVRVNVAERMPSLKITPDEASALTNYLTTVFIVDGLEKEPIIHSGAASRGREQYRTLGCRGCHAIEDGGGYVGPDLNGVGLRLRAGWLVSWLRDPQKWKPGVLMTGYDISDGQTVELAAYLLGFRRSPTAFAGGAQ